MKKIQKVWLWIGLGMFFVPEILWSPFSNTLYEFFQKSNHVQPFRNTFLENPSNINIFSTILFIQFIGALISLVCVWNLKRYFNRNDLYWLVVSFILLITLITLLFFGLSVSLRGIGF